MGKRARGREGTVRLDATADVEEPSSLQARLEHSYVGRAVITGVIVFLLAALLVSNIPGDSEASDVLYPRFRPFLSASGLEQTWHLFGPEPRRQTKWLEANLTYADGTSVRWQQPQGSERFISTYRGYRWQKLSKSIMGRRSLWHPAATWIARHNQRNGEWPTSVVLLRRQYLYPGVGRPQRPSWQQEQFYGARFTPDGEEAGR